MSEAENVAVVKNLVEALNTWDLDAWMSCFTEDVTGRGMLNGATSSGKNSAAIGIEATRSVSKAGSVLHCSSISNGRPTAFTCKSSRKSLEGIH